jgi:hypothetical protein
MICYTCDAHAVNYAIETKLGLQLIYEMTQKYDSIGLCTTS